MSNAQIDTDVVVNVLKKFWRRNWPVLFTIPIIADSFWLQPYPDCFLDTQSGD